VKTSRFPDLNVFELSLWEWEFANAQPRVWYTSYCMQLFYHLQIHTYIHTYILIKLHIQVNYHIYRVFNASDPANCRVTILRDVPRLVRERRIKLCLAVWTYTIPIIDRQRAADSTNEKPCRRECHKNGEVALPKWFEHDIRYGLVFLGIVSSCYELLFAIDNRINAM
jgi:hypothetical protein